MCYPLYRECLTDLMKTPVLFAILSQLAVGGQHAFSGVYEEYLTRYFPKTVANVWYSQEYESPGVLKGFKIKTRNDAHSYFISAIKPADHMMARLRKNPDVPLDSILTNEMILMSGPADYKKRFLSQNQVWMELWNLSSGAAEEIAGMEGRKRTLAVRDYSHNYFRVKSLLHSDAQLAGAVSKDGRDYSALAIEAMKRASLVSLTGLGENELMANPLAAMADQEGLPDSLRLLFRDPDSFYQFPYWEKFDHLLDFSGSSHFHAYAIFPGRSKTECGKIVASVAAALKVEGGPVPEMIPGMEFVLIRYAAALDGGGYSVRLPVVEEVFYRKFGPYTRFDGESFDPASSDFYGGIYKLYGLDRNKFLKGDAFYLKEFKDEDSVFYGFSTDVPNKAARHVTTVRSNCTDCHASSAATWHSVFSISNLSYYDRVRSSGEIKFIKKDQHSVILEYIK